MVMDCPVQTTCYWYDNVMLSQPQRRSILGGAVPPIPRFLPEFIPSVAEGVGMTFVTLNWV